MAVATRLLPCLFVIQTEQSSLGAQTLRVALIVLGILVIALALWYGRSVVIIGVLGLIFGLVMSRAVDFLERHGWRRGLATVTIAATVIGSIVGVCWWIGPRVQAQFAELRQRLPEVVSTVERRLDATGIIPDSMQPQTPSKVAAPGEKPQEESSLSSILEGDLGRLIGPATRVVVPVVSTVLEAVSAIIIMLFVAIFFAVSPRTYKRGFVRLFPVARRSRVEEVTSDVGDALGRWMAARLMAMVAVGTITGVALGVIGLESALALGVVAGLLEFVPFFGPVIAAIPAIGIALVDSPEKALATLIAFVVIQQIEGNVLTPLLLQNRVDVPPLLTVLAVPLLTVVVGATSVLIAEPMIAVALVLVRELWVDRLEGSAGTKSASSASGHYKTEER